MEYTKEEFEKLQEKVNTYETLSKGLETKNAELLANATDATSSADLQKQLEAKEAKIYEMQLNNRLSTVSKYLETKGNDAKLLAKTGEMDDNHFEVFSEGRTNEIFQSKDEIESAKTDLAQERTEFDTNKEQALKDALKQLELDNKTRNDQGLVPNTEIGTDLGGDQDDDSGFPTMEALEKVYNLPANPMWEDKTPKMKDRASAYMVSYGGQNME